MNSQNDVAILSAVRTPIGKYGGALASLSAVQLGIHAAKNALARAGLDPACVDMTVVGLARQAGCGPNPGRQISLGAGAPNSATAYTLNQACASGLAAIAAAARHIRAGEADIVLAVGAESMSNVPYLLDDVRFGKKLGHRALVDAMYRDGLYCPMAEKIMGETVEALAGEFSLSRERQDEYACESQNRYEKAWKAGHFQAELAPLPHLDHDEHPRAGTTTESLSKLKPVFDASGTITAGNSSGITDAASCLLLASEKARRQLGAEALAYFQHCVTIGLEPARMGLGPVGAIAAYERRADISLDQIDLLEINEAFAAQILACDAQRPLPWDRVNVNGGSIAMGHPIGCSGNRIAVTLIQEMVRRRAARGLASLCVSGGLGICAGFSLA